MKTTVDIPETLFKQASLITGIKSKNDLLIGALRNVVNQNKWGEIKQYQGKFNLSINLDILRKRKHHAEDSCR